MADRSVIELPAPFLVDGNGSGSNGSNGKGALFSRLGVL